MLETLLQHELYSLLSFCRGDRLSVLPRLAPGQPRNLPGDLMGGTAVGTTRTFGKRNGGSKENDIRITGSSLPCGLSSVTDWCLFLSHENQLKIIFQFHMMSELNGKFRQSSTRRAENSFCVRACSQMDLADSRWLHSCWNFCKPGSHYGPLPNPSSGSLLIGGSHLSTATDLQLWAFARGWQWEQSRICPQKFSLRKSTRASNAAGPHLSLAEGFSSLLMRLQEVAKL